MASITYEKLIELAAERSILFDLINQFYHEQLRIDNVWDGISLQCSEVRITNSDAEGLSEFRADGSYFIPTWCATALRRESWTSVRLA